MGAGTAPDGGGFIIQSWERGSPFPTLERPAGSSLDETLTYWGCRWGQLRICVLASPAAEAWWKAIKVLISLISWGPGPALGQTTP